MPTDAPVNIGAPPERPVGPRRRVSEMQTKLHRWAAADPGRRFDDLFNLVHDPATLLVAFDRVVHQVEQVIKPVAGIGRRPTVKFGLHLRYPPTRPDGPFRRGADVHRRVFRHCSLHPFS